MRRLFPIAFVVYFALLAGCTPDAGSPDFTSDPIRFAPVEDAIIQSGRTFTSMFIPRGVTVTSDGNLIVHVEGEVLIEGELHAGGYLRLGSEESISITGVVRSMPLEPEDPDFPEGIRIISAEEITIDDGLLDGGGEIELRIGDPDSLNVEPPPFDWWNSLPETRLGIGHEPKATAAPLRCIVVSGGTIQPVEESAPTGIHGIDGGPGYAGAGVRLTAPSIILGEGATIRSQSGGPGGAASSTAHDDIDIEAGEGGRGGPIELSARDSIQLSGSARLVTGSGGPGGEATAVTNDRIEAPVGWAARADGGDGGGPGRLRLSSGSVPAGLQNLRITIGDGGVGGNAFAQGGDGRQDCNGRVAQSGGNAFATGGDGGDATGNRITLFGWNEPAETPLVDGGNGGAGGEAIALGGRGGRGNEECSGGGRGGVLGAFGGDGGDATLVSPFNDEPYGTGGDGGPGVFRGGNGGPGRHACICPATEGGIGGEGGSTVEDAGGGSGGSGAQPGNAGAAILDSAGNGGWGGQGAFPGWKGSSGEWLGSEEGGVETLAPSFEDGLVGVLCGERARAFSGDFLLSHDSSPPLDRDLLGSGGFERPIRLQVRFTCDAFPETGEETTTEISIESSGNFIRVEGELTASHDAYGFSLRGVGDVAGHQNVQVLFEGSYDPVRLALSGTYTFGLNGTLPTGIVSYTIDTKE